MMTGVACVMGRQVPGRVNDHVRDDASADISGKEGVSLLYQQARKQCGNALS
jgi:hypothetical protein